MALGQYPVTRAQAEVLQARLTAYFEEPRVAVAWHAVRDRLTVRYYYEVSGHESPHGNNIRDENCKGSNSRFHTGLSTEELNDPNKVSNAYKFHLKTTAQLIFICPLRPRRNSSRAKRAVDRGFLEETKEQFDYREPAGRKALVPPELRNRPDGSATTS